MIISTQNHILASSFGMMKANDILADAGYDAIDISFFGDLYSFIFEDDYIETAKKMKNEMDKRGVSINQAHAPFGGGYENYTQNLLPQMPRV